MAPCANHTATLLPNGKVLIAGGFSNNVSLASAELFDPATGTCTNTGSMMVGRANHTATLLTNGKVLVAGGQNIATGTILSDAELYDPTTGAWSITGTLDVPRYAHTATLLEDGTVLVAGGGSTNAAGADITDSAELYYPATGAWSEVSSMNTARASHTATLLPNGQVLVAAGVGSNFTELASAEIYDPVSATWTTTNSLNTARASHTATLLRNGQVLVAGGFQSSVEVFDPASGIWTTTNSMNTGRQYHTATLLPDGNVLVAGGITYEPPPDGYFLPTNSAELYNTATGTWTNAAFLNIARESHVATLLPGGKVLVTGGYGTNGPVAITETYDSTVNPATGAWSNTASMQTGRDDFTMTLLPNGKVLAVGGGDFSGNFFSSAELYDPPTQTWTNTGAMNETRSDFTATLLPNGKVLVAGGFSTVTSFGLSSAELYDPSSGQWTETTPMIAARRDQTATLLRNGKVLVAGGNAEGGPTSEIYDPATTSWTATGEMIYPGAPALGVLLANGKVLVMTDGGGITPTALSAELYDPATGEWVGAGSTTVADQDFAAATLLSDGKVLLIGEDANHLPIATVYDPTTGTWAIVAPPESLYEGPTATLLPNGKVLVAGLNFNSSSSNTTVFDPAINQWMDTGMLNEIRDNQAAVLLPDGRVLVAGGEGFPNGQGTNLTSAELYDSGLGFSNVYRPQITYVTSLLNLGGNLTINGIGFQGVSEASGGDTQNSSTAYPLVQLRNIESQETTFLLTTNWGANSFTSLPVWNFPPGYALATVFVNGIQSTSSIVNISVPVPVMTSLTGAGMGSNGAFQFCFTNSPGAILGILASTNLSLPLSNWTALGGVTEVSPGQFQFADPRATNNGQAFYQLFAP